MTHASSGKPCQKSACRLSCKIILFVSLCNACYRVQRKKLEILVRNRMNRVVMPCLQVSTTAWIFFKDRPVCPEWEMVENKM